MTTIRTVATHDLVQALHPRPPTEVDQVGMATGRAIDSALAQSNYEQRQGRRPTLSATVRHATELLDEGLAEVDTEVDAAARDRLLREITGVITAFRKSELAGLLRPKSRLILIAEEVGVYAQPDFWNGRDRVYEMKSYRAEPIPEDVGLQLGMFQLAFHECTAVLVCFDRHAEPVPTLVRELPALEEERRASLIQTAYRLGRELGTPKVLEYIDSPTVRYSLPVG